MCVLNAIMFSGTSRNLFSHIQALKMNSSGSSCSCFFGRYIMMDNNIPIMFNANGYMSDVDKCIIIDKDCANERLDVSLH